MAALDPGESGGHCTYHCRELGTGPHSLSREHRPRAACQARDAVYLRRRSIPFLATAKAHLDEDAFAAAWAEGRVMTVEEAVADVLALPAPDTG